MRGEGPKPCLWLILGEAPGASEDAAGRPFVGPSGALLEAALGGAGIPRSAVYITNAYKLRPPENRTPTAAELRAHQRLLAREFDEVQPESVLTLGNVPLHVLCPEAPGVTKARGQAYVADDWGVVVYPTYHPAYVLRNPNEKETFFEDVRDYFHA